MKSLLGNDFCTLLRLKSRLDYSKHRKLKYKTLLRDKSNWNLVTKKELFIKKFLKHVLINFIKRIFLIKKNIIINVFEHSHGLLERNTLGLKKTMLVRIAAEYKIGHLVGILKRKLQDKKTVKGLRIRVVGRYQKKLRNRKIAISYGRIKPNNINVPISYINFIIIYRFGTCGIKITYLRDSYNCEFF